MTFKSRFISVALFALIPFAVYSQWNTVNPANTGTLYTIAYDPTGTSIWIGTSNGISYSSNGGSNFSWLTGINQSLGNTPILGTFETIHPFGVNSASASGTFNIGNDLIIFGTTNPGLGWTMNYLNSTGTLPRQIKGMDYKDNLNGVAVGAVARIFTTANAGSTWTARSISSTSDLYSVAHVTGSTYVAVGTNLQARSTNDGSSWTLTTVPSKDYNKVSFSGTTGYASYNGAGIDKSTDGGVTWTTLPFYGGTVRLVYALSTDTIFAATSTDLFRSCDGGAYWDCYKLPGYERINAISFFDSQTSMAVGNSGYAIKTSNGGGQPYPYAYFTAPTGTLCAGASVTFTNYGNPAYTYAWDFGGLGTSASYSPSFTFATAGIYNVQLIATGTNGLKDTAVVSVSITGPPSVSAFSVVANNDTVCKNSTSSILVPASEPGVTYRLRNGYTSIGASQAGTGSVLSFNSGVLAASVTLNVIGTRTNACASDSVVVPVYVFVLAPSALTSVSVTRDSICYPDTSTILVSSSETGWRYTWNEIPNGLPSAPVVNGTGGTIQLSLPSFSTTETFTVQATQIQYGCVINLPNSQVIAAFRPTQSFSVTPNLALTGQPVTIVNGSTQYNRYAWDFGAAATPSTSNLVNPGSVVYNSAFSDTIRFTAMVGDSICYYRGKLPITAVPPAAPSSPLLCQSDSLPNAYTVSEIFLDRFNSKYITGYTSLGNDQAFVAKFDSTGKQEWFYQHAYADAVDNTFGKSVGADDYGNVYWLMQNSGSRVRFNNQWINSSSLMVSFDRNGKYRWSMSMPQMGNMVAGDSGYMYAVAYIPGGYISTFEADGDRFFYSTNPADTNAGSACILSFDANGNFHNVYEFGRYADANGNWNLLHFITNQFSEFSAAPRLLRDKSGKLKIAATIDRLPSGALAYAGNVPILNYASDSVYSSQQSLLVVSFDPSTGLFDYAATVIGGVMEPVRALACDDSSNLYVAGHIRGLIIRNNVLMTLDTAASGPDPLFNYLVRVAPGGGLDWYTATRYGYYHDLQVVDSVLVSLASFPNVGSFYDKNFQAYGLQASGYSDVALVNYRLNGTMQSIQQSGSATADWGWRFAKDKCGYLHSAEIRNVPQYNYPNPSSCSCAGQYKTRLFTYTPGGCGGVCHDMDPSLRDLAADSLYLGDTSATGQGNRMIMMRILNEGQVPVTTAQLSYKLNKLPVQTMTWNGLLNYGQSAWVAIGSDSMNARHFNRIVAWVQTVNGSTGAVLGNDTVRLEQFVCHAPLSGTYTIDSVSGEIPNFDIAARILATCGISGPVVMQAVPGVYGGQVVINPVPGSSRTNTVTWTSTTQDSSDVLLTYFPSSATIASTVYLNPNTSDQIFTKLSMTSDAARTPGVAGTSAYCTGTNCNRIRLENCFFRGAATTAAVVERGNLGGCDSCVYRHNLISLGQSGLRTADSHNLLEGNVFDRQSSIALDMTYASDVVARNNFFVAADTASWSSNIYCATRNAYGSNIELTGNTAHVCLNSTAGAFRMYSVSSTGNNRNLFANNTLVNHYRTAGGAIAGLNIQNVSNLDVLHNTMDMCINSTGTNSSIQVLNNYIRQSGNGLLLNSSAGWTIDYNVYYNSYFADTSNWSSLYYIESDGHLYRWFEWQGTGHDSHSTITDVPLMSDVDYHLVQSASPRGIPLASVTTDCDGEPRSAVIPFIGSDELNVYSDVWPGDANNDLTVNQYDLLPLGLFFGEHGNARDSVSNAWHAWSCNDWGKLQPNGANMKFADCDGNGTMDFDDTLAVNLYFGLTHRGSIASFPVPLSGQPELTVDAGTGLYLAGDTVTLRITGGSALAPFTGMYSLGFDVQTDPSILQPGSGRVDMDSCFFALPGQRLQYGAWDVPAGQLHISLSRINHTDTSGYGLVATARFVVNQNITSPLSTSFSIPNYQAFNSTGTPYALDMIGDSITVLPTSVHDAAADAGIYIYPNPATDATQILLKHPRRHLAVSLTDALGRLAWKKEFENAEGVITVPLKELAAGTYHLILESDAVRTTKLLMKQ